MRDQVVQSIEPRHFDAREAMAQLAREERERAADTTIYPTNRAARRRAERIQRKRAQ